MGYAARKEGENRVPKSMMDGRSGGWRLRGWSRYRWIHDVLDDLGRILAKGVGQRGVERCN